MKSKLLLLTFVLPIFLYSQRVTVIRIGETRSTGESYYGNRTELDVQISGDEVRRYKFARISAITKAVDDQGFELIGEETSTTYEEVSGNASVATIKLENASRKAETIKELSGTLSLFSPTEANGGIVKIKEIGSQTNKNLTPKDKELSVVYLTKESYEKFTNEQKDKREAELKKQSKEIQELAKGVMGLMDIFSYNDWSYPQVNLMVTGDASKIVKVSVEKPNGEELSSNGSSYTDKLRTYYFSEEILPDYTLTLTVEVGGAIKSIPFNIKDIILP
jgi:hypothetical protein